MKTEKLMNKPKLTYFWDFIEFLIKTLVNSTLAECQHVEVKSIEGVLSI